jgi:hypothetical protein
MPQNYQLCPVRRINLDDGSYRALKPRYTPESITDNDVIWPEICLAHNFRVSERAKKNGGKLYVLSNCSLQLWHNQGEKYSAKGLAGLATSKPVIFVADRETASRLEQDWERLTNERKRRMGEEMLIRRIAMMGKVFKFPIFIQ